MAHALLGYDGACKFIHGHSYGLSVTVIGKPIKDELNPKLGMVIDFGDLKRIVKSQVVDVFDHAFVLNNKTPEDAFQRDQELFNKVIFVDYQPTSENMIIDFAERIQQELPASLKLHCIKLRETATSFAEWCADDQQD
jgi:6-pyruvoyltetrahydropterin/6-carboxytetrahydropterin synthase